VLLPRQPARLDVGLHQLEHPMPKTASAEIAIIGIDIGKNSFHVVAHDGNGNIILRQKWSRGQVESRLANVPPCLVGMEACVGAHHLARKLISLGHDARLMPARYVRPYAKGQKNDLSTTPRRSWKPCSGRR
jgi:transposase